MYFAQHHPRKAKTESASYSSENHPQKNAATLIGP